MRSRHFRMGPAWASRINPDPIPSFVPSVELEVTEKFALLWLRKGDAGQDSLYWKLTDAMLAMGIMYAPPDFDALRRHGYASRGSDRRHVLTPSGIYKAQAIGRDLARQYRVHHITFHAAARFSNMGHFASCSCGEWQQTVGRANHHRDRLHRLAQHHLDQFKSGSLVFHPPMNAVEPENGRVRTDVLRALPSTPGAVVVASVSAAAPGMEISVSEEAQ